MKDHGKAIRRLQIIKGQISALITALEGEETKESCKKLFPQIKAVKNAFLSFFSAVMVEELEDRIKNKKSTEEINELVHLFAKL